MKALVVTRFGMPPETIVEERLVPVMRRRCSVVRMHAATINQLSNTVRSGGLPGLRAPLVLGNEGAGIVEASERFAPGTHVAVYGAGQLGLTEDGLQQQWVVVENTRLLALPATLSLDEGAAVTVNYITAHQALRRVAHLQAGQTVVIPGATGALGHALVEVAQALGARVIAAVSTPEKARRALQAGAGTVVDLSKGDLGEAVMAATGGGGADLALDPVGGAMTGRLLRATRPHGTVVAIGFAGGTQASIDMVDLVVHEKRLLGYDLHLETDVAVAEALGAIGDLIGRGSVRPVIDRVYAMDDVESGYRRLASREAVGAILLRL